MSIKLPTTFDVLKILPLDEHQPDLIFLNIINLMTI